MHPVSQLFQIKDQDEWSRGWKFSILKSWYAFFCVGLGARIWLVRRWMTYLYSVGSLPLQTALMQWPPLEPTERGCLWKRHPMLRKFRPKGEALSSRITVKSKLNNRIGKKVRNIELASSLDAYKNITL